MHCDDFMIAAITRKTLVPGQPLIWPFSFWTLLLLMLPAEKQSFDSQKCFLHMLEIIAQILAQITKEIPSRLPAQIAADSAASPMHAASRIRPAI